MDKQSIIGFVLIFLILIGFTYLNRPTKAQLEAARQRDSIAAVEALRAQEAALIQAESHRQNDAQNEEEKQLAIEQQKQNTYGVFASFAEGKNEHYTFENDVMALTMASKGGRIASVRLKDYVTGDSLPLILFNEEHSSFGITLITNNNRIIETDDLSFEYVAGENPLEFVFRLPVNEENYLDFVYTMQQDDYMMHFDIRGKGLEQLLAPGLNSLDIHCNVRMISQEKGRKFEQRYSMLQYKFLGDDVEKLSESKDDHKSISSRLKWISFKDQFFAAIMICDKGFLSNELSSVNDPITSPYIKSYQMQSAIEFDMRGSREANLQFYFGPSKYSILKKYDKNIDKENRLQLDRIVPLGGNIVRWVNVVLVLPMFNFFGKFISNFGIIIILMTLCIKLIIFPLTYKSFMSSAKMRLLKPQIDEINAKYPGESKAAERSQATMNFYKQAGVNPMGGCLPMLLQFPVLIAMFWFFPASIELRQESFLWAKDLSTYDALISWEANIPLISKLFGNHISLFCLLMTLANILSTKISSDANASGNQMPGMKTMMYLMPVMFLFIFNQYASGLSFYYLVSTLFTILQTYLFRAFLNEEKVLKQLNENKNKPPRKSAFQKRLEEAQRLQREQAKLQAKQRKY